MSRKSGIVLKIEKHKAYIMESGGNIIEIKTNQQWKQGDIVSYLRPQIRYSLWISAVAALLIIFLGFYGGSYYLEPKYIISVDVNPSLELTVNPLGRVTKVTAMNEEGESVKTSISILNKKYEEAVVTIVESSVMSKYIGKGVDVTMSVVGENTELTEEMISLITKTVAQTDTASRYELELECYQTNQESLEKAHHMGITAGKYYYIEQLTELGVDVEAKGCIHHSISDLKEEIKKCRGDGNGNGYGTKNDHRTENNHGKSQWQSHGQQHGKGKSGCEEDSP